MRIFSSKKRVAIIGAVTAVTLVGGGTAFAYWTTSGTGNGSATAGSSVGWSVTLAPIATGVLAPTSDDGTPMQTASYTIANSGAGQQFLSQALVTVDSVSGGGSGPGAACAITDFQLGSPAAGQAFTQPINQNLAAGTGSYTGTVDLRLVDNGVDQNNCKGATVHLKVVAS
jgi:hypothetical protein